MLVGVAGVENNVEVLHKGGAQDKMVQVAEALLDDTQVAHLKSGAHVLVAEEETLGRDSKGDGFQVIVVGGEGKSEVGHAVKYFVAVRQEVAPLVVGASDRLVRIGSHQVIFEHLKCALRQGDEGIARVDQRVLAIPDVTLVEAGTVEPDLPRVGAARGQTQQLVALHKKVFVDAAEADGRGLLGAVVHVRVHSKHFLLDHAFLVHLLEQVGLVRARVP